MLGKTVKRIEELGRFREIVATLIQYGFEPLVERLQIPGTKFLSKRLPTRGDGLDVYERIREAMEDLGPTFVKFGQILSVRPDLVPAPLIEQLSRLQDEAREFPFDDVRLSVEESLGGPMAEVFSNFDESPLASASLSQVHGATLRRNGRSVCVKVQRPGILENVEQDLDILAFIARQVHERAEELQIYDFPAMVQHMHKTLLDELDFLREAQNIRIARSRLDPDEPIRIPRAYQALCKERLLVTERIHGCRLREADLALDRAENLARVGLRFTLKQTLIDGFFHADPHPGNVMITQSGELAVVDWGMVGRLTPDDRRELLYLLKAALQQDSQRLLDALTMINAMPGITDKRELELELLKLLDRHYSSKLRDMRVGRLLIEATFLLARHHVPLPPTHMFMVKALLTSEGTARELCPDFDMRSETQAAIQNLGLDHSGPVRLWREAGRALEHIRVLHRNLPTRFANIMERLATGSFTMRFEHENLGGLQRTLESTFNRLTFGIIIGALIIGSSMIITTGVKPLVLGYPALGLVGYFISAAMGLLLIIDILRHR